MFDSVLRARDLPKRRFGVGTSISVLAHAGAIAFFVWAASRPQNVDKQDVAVTFVKAPPPPTPPPPPPAPKTVRPKVKSAENQTVLQQAIVAPTEVPTEKPEEKEPPKDLTPANGEGGDGGDVAAVPGGIKGPVVDAADVAPTGPVQYDEGTMTKPVYQAGPAPEYTQKALENEVEGTMVVKCVVTIKGEVKNCRVLRSLPYMDKAVITALEKRHYKPSYFNGKPIEVEYTFNIKLTLP